VLVAVFDTQEDAVRALDGLREAGVRPEHVSLMMSQGQAAPGEDDRGADVAGGAASGATMGGILGGLAGWLIGLGALTIPGIGPVLGAGILGSILAGAAIGAAAGGLLGGLVGLGVPEEEARGYEAHVRAGRILLTIHTADAATAGRLRDIAEANGAYDVRIYGGRAGAPAPDVPVAAPEGYRATPAVPATSVGAGMDPMDVPPGEPAAYTVSNTVDDGEETREPPHATWTGEAVGGAAGAITGGIIGAVAGGPVGAAIGAAVGGGAGAGAMHMATEPNTQPTGSEVGAGTGAVVGGIMGAPGGPVGMAVGAALGGAVGGASGEMVQDATEEIIEERKLLREAAARDRSAPAPERGVAPTPPAAPAGVPGATESPVAHLTGPAEDLSGRAGAPPPPATDTRELTGQATATPYRGAGDAARSAKPGEIQVVPDTPGDRGIDWPEADVPGDRGPRGTDTEYRSGGAGARGEASNDQR
jgi:hypothetical protein